MKPKQQPQPHYLNRSWQYHDSSTHADVAEFAKRQRERLQQATQRRPQ